MITSAFIYLASLVIALFLLLLSPFQGSSGFPEGVDTAMATAASYVGYIDVFIPLSVLHTVIVFVIGFEMVSFFFKLMRWLFSFMPFVGGR